MSPPRSDRPDGPAAPVGLLTRPEAAPAVPPAGPGPAPAGAPDDSPPAARPATEPGLPAVAAAFLLPVAFSPELYHSFWAPKAAVCLLLVGPGLVALARLARAGSVPARLAGLFVAAAALSTATSPSVVASLTGGANWGTGLVFVAAVAGAWALGVTAGEQRRRQLAAALVAAALINAAMAWLQARGLVPPSLESAGRSSGLMGNPVHLGALAAGALWLAGERLGRGRWRRSAPWLGAVALLAGAAQLSGGRSAVGLVALATVAVARRAGWKRALAIVAAVAAGFLAAPAWAADGAVSGSARAVGPESTRQVDVRLGLWRISAEAALDRPLLGWGPGRFHEATSPRYTPVVSEGGVKAYHDAHNWVVEYAVTTGAVGLLLLAGWLVTAGRAGAGALAGFAAVVGLFMLVEPQSVGLTPLALLALGASSRPGPGVGPARRGWRLASAVGVVAGVAAAGVLLTGEALLHQAVLDTSPARHARAAALLPPWADVSRIGARIESFAGLHSEPDRRDALALARQATRRDPADPSAWSNLGRLELEWGTDEAAARALERALERNPWHADALLSGAVLAGRTGDAAARADRCRRLEVLDKAPPVCGGPATVRP